MEYMALFILDDPAVLDAVLKAWVDGGIRGATIMESTGLYRRQRKMIPMRYLYSSPDADEKENVAMFALVESKEAAERCLELTESVVGDLNNPHTGVFAAWPLGLVKGLSRPDYPEGE